MHHRPTSGEAAAVAAHVFDDLASGYETVRNREFYGAAARMMSERTRFNLTTVRRGLDLACGTGISTEIVVRATPDTAWHGVDASAEMLAFAAAKESLAGVTWTKAPAECTGLPDNEFDWIICNIAYHWFHPDAAIEIHRLLSPQGKVSLVAPLLPTTSQHSGNRWLRQSLKRCAPFTTARRSQGLTLPLLKGELAPFTLTHVETWRHAETFASSDEMLHVLATRGSLHAIFGEHASEAERQLRGQASNCQPLDLLWSLALVEAQK